MAVENAQNKTKVSPIPRLNFSFIQSRYIPIVARNIQIQICKGTRFPKNRPKIGTITIYKAVINPAFPTVVYEMPICCNEAVTNTIQPQIIPPLKS